MQSTQASAESDAALDRPPLWQSTNRGPKPFCGITSLNSIEVQDFRTSFRGNYSMYVQVERA
jgi:hypothetical protein